MGAHKYGGKKMRGGSAAVTAAGDILKKGCSETNTDAAAKLGCKIGVSAGVDCASRGVDKCARELSGDITHPVRTIARTGETVLHTGEATVNAVTHPVQTVRSIGSTIVGGFKHIFGGKKHGKKSMKHKKKGKKDGMAHGTKRHAKKHGKKHSKKTMKHAKKGGMAHGKKDRTRRH